MKAEDSNSTRRPEGNPADCDPLAGDSLDEIVERIELGKATVDDLFAAARVRLLRLISVRMPVQLIKRVDPEDIIQESFIAASKRFGEYLAGRKVPVFIWLRGLAIERLIDAQRYHLGAAKRDIRREDAAKHWIDQSTFELLHHVASNQKTPSRLVADQQRNSNMRNALLKLSDRYREVLVLRFFESLSVAETAAAMNTSVANTKVLQFRALQKLEDVVINELNWQSADREN